MKGISPIIASVLLIAITMSIAVILAAYVTNYTQQATSSIPSACIGGALFFRTGYPTVSLVGTDCDITAGVESQFSDLEGLQIEVDKDGIISYPITGGDVDLLTGRAGYVTASVPCTTVADITSIRVSTSNCFNVKTPWTAPQ